MIKRQTLTGIIIILMLFAAFANAQANRTIDGSNNNLENPEWGAAHTPLVRVTDVAYANNFDSPAGVNRPNPRAISNMLFSQNGLLNEPSNLSCYIWTFGQFLDHDIDLTEDAANEFEMINVPMGDPWFDPMSTGSVNIPMKRSKPLEGTGTSFVNPRQHGNSITSFIDGSGVYGSDQEAADWLRTFEDGKLKVSQGNFLPFNTTTGELGDGIDSDAPFMDDAVGLSPKIFVAGDARANENVLLLSFHTLFVREHNRLCEEIKSDNPSWSDEQIYQHARKKVGGFIQSIVYNEFLPSMGIQLSEYEGYDNTVNPSIMNIFSGAAYRLHSLINNEILRVGNDGNVIAQGNLSLRDAFFNPMELLSGGGVDPLFKGMAELITQDFDSKIIDDLRNFLFGVPGAGGLDLASININRGRERGFPDFNTVRSNFGLTPYNSFDEITSNSTLASQLETLYGDINDIDPFVGFVAEDKMPNALLGETSLTIIARQFQVLRDGDRYYYWIDDALSNAEKSEISRTRLVDIIMRNTGVTLMQGNLFSAMDHSTLEACGAASPNVTIVGNIANDLGAGLSNVDLDFEGSPLISDFTTNNNGSFEFATVPTCYDYVITPSKDDDPLNGVSTYDLVLIQSHILGVSGLSNAYRTIAADTNADGNITTFDIIELRQLILSIIPDFPSNTSWRFVDANQVFLDPANPFLNTFSESYTTNSLTNDAVADFVGIKVGDVNGDADPLGGNSFEDRNLNDKLIFRVQDRAVAAGQTYTVQFKANDLDKIIGYQFTLNFDPSVLSFVEVESGKLRDLGAGNFGVFAKEGMITTSWNGTNEMQKSDVVFSIKFKALANGNLRDLLSINSRLTPEEAISADFELLDIALQFDGVEGMDEPLVLEDKYEVYQNYPNPFTESTMIGVYMPKASEASIRISDASGKVLQILNEDFKAGYNKINLSRKTLDASGILYYEVKTNFGTVSKKMVLID